MKKAVKTSTASVVGLDFDQLRKFIEQATHRDVHLVGRVILAFSNLSTNVSDKVGTNLCASRLSAHQLSFSRDFNLVHWNRVGVGS